MKKKSLNEKQIKYIIIFSIVLIFFLFGLIIYKNLFGGINSSRLNGIKNYKLTNNEINSTKDKINELGSIESVDISTNYKIIKIFIKLKEDVEFNKVQEVSNSLLENISKKNLSYYDVEIFVESSNKSSEVYPKIGYKHKTNKEFVW